MSRIKMWAYINLFGEREVVEVRDIPPYPGMKGRWIVAAEDGTEYITALENFVIRRAEVDENGDER